MEGRPKRSIAFDLIEGIPKTIRPNYRLIKKFIQKKKKNKTKQNKKQKKYAKMPPLPPQKKLIIIIPSPLFLFIYFF